MWSSSTLCRKVTLFLLLSQTLMFGILYYNGTYPWKVVMTNINPTDLEKVHPGESSTPESLLQRVSNSSVTDLHGIDSESSTSGVGITISSHGQAGTKYTTSIAIGLGITTRKLSNIAGPNIKKMPFFRSLLKSFCETASGGYDYHFYLGYDYNDQYLSQQSNLGNLAKEFTTFTERKCQRNSAYSLHFVLCRHTKKPAWAQNDAMVEAYLSGMEYFYRTNDDTLMKTKNWTERFIDTLDQFIPPRIGVVGPKHRGGNTAILTYDFTHRTHLEIHGFYYPREFPDWYGDRWVTDVYKPGRSIKLPDVLLVHTMETGQRYKNSKKTGSEVNAVIQRDRETVVRYIQAVENGFRIPDHRKVIAMTLSDSDPAQLWGVIRNAQLAAVTFPGWTLQIYANKSHIGSNQMKPKHISAANNSYIPENVIKTVQTLGAKVIPVDPELLRTIPTGMWHYLVADEPEVEVFLVRNPDERLSERDHAAVEHWMNAKSPQHTVHCIKDHSNHLNQTIIDGLWGAKVINLKSVLGKTPMRKLMQDYVIENQKTHDANTTQESFLSTFLYPKLEGHIVYYDSITCDKPHSSPFPVERKRFNYVGQKYDAHEQPLIKDKFIVLASRNPNCEISR